MQVDNHGWNSALCPLPSAFSASGFQQRIAMRIYPACAVQSIHDCSQQPLHLQHHTSHITLSSGARNGLPRVGMCFWCPHCPDPKRLGSQRSLCPCSVIPPLAQYGRLNMSRRPPERAYRLRRCPSEDSIFQLRLAASTPQLGPFPY